MVYRYQNLNASIPIGNAQLLIHEIRASNLDEDKQTKRWLNDEIPWKYQLLAKALEMGVPPSWQIPILKAISFYSRPPLAEDYWSLQICGTFIYPQDIDADEYTLSRFTIHTYPGITGGKSSRRDALHNAAMISVQGKIEPQHLDKPLKLKVFDNENYKSVLLIFTQEWQKERHWQVLADYNSPAAPMWSFLDLLYANRPQQTLEYVLPQLRKDFPLPQPDPGLQGKNIQFEGRLAWVDLFDGYLNVYRVDAQVGEFSDNGFAPQEKLSFYTVRDRDGDYKIIKSICWESPN